MGRVAESTAIESNSDSRWRETLLNRLLHWTVLVGAVIAVNLTYRAAYTDEIDTTSWSFAGMYLSYAALVVVRFLPRLGFRTRALAASCVYLAVGASAIDGVGVAVAPVLILALSVVTSGLFFGRRGLWLSALAGALVLLQFIDPHRLPSVPPTSAALGFVCLSVALAVLVLSVVQSLEQSLAATKRTLAELRCEQQLREKTQAELVETQSTLYHAQKLNAVGRLAAGVAHDFNNTLQVVIGWTELLETTDSLEERAEYLAHIKAAAIHSSGLTRQLLSFTRPELRRVERLSVDALLPNLVKSYRRLLPDDVSVHLELEPDLWVLMDESQLGQALLNLVLNAKDAMPTGGRIELAARSIAHGDLPAIAAGLDGAAVALTVSDTGHGMNEEVKSRIFEPFFTTKGEQGNGLGLSMVYGVVQASGGVISVRSTPGEGTCFELLLPAAPQLAATETTPGRTQAARSRPGPSKLLLAEDDYGVRASLAQALRHAGFSVVEVADVQSGIEQLQAQAKDAEILVTDGIMPGGQTSELIAKFLSLHPSGRVILCSGYVDDELSPRNLASTRFEFLPKPFAPSELVDKLQSR